MAERKKTTAAARRRRAEAAHRELVEQLQERIQQLAGDAEHWAGECRDTTGVLRLVQRRAAMLEEQRDFAMGFASRLLDKIAGIQLTAHVFTMEQANDFVINERGAGQRQMLAIEAKYDPAPNQGADVERPFTDAKQGITAETYGEADAA